MPLFIKTEFIKKKYLSNLNFREKIIQQHIIWVKKLKNKGVNINSGFLVDHLKKPGGGGLLMIECESYLEAEKIINSDPMVTNNIVDWKLHEWINVSK
tara:strand:+ start:1033 stop:1326 length:294 start_codon:yes stop_codon:yes gene_type:complete